MATDSDLRQRIAACAAKEGLTEPHPTQWADKHQWQLAATPGWEEAWQYAREVGEVERLGLSDVVVNDTMILSAVQPLVGTPNEE